MTNHEVIQVIDVELDLIKDEIEYYIVTAKVDNMVETLRARYYPTDYAHPAEYGPAECSGTFQLEPGDPKPPEGDTESLRKYVEELDLDWQVDTND